MLLLLQWVRGLPGTELLELKSTMAGETLLRVYFHVPTALEKMLQQLPYVADVVEEEPTLVKGPFTGALGTGHTIYRRFLVALTEH